MAFGDYTSKYTEKNEITTGFQQLELKVISEDLFTDIPNYKSCKNYKCAANDPFFLSIHAKQKTEKMYK
ncbi:MAG: hypothetical protein COC06_12480 [Bacteroidales bacterium]|nr:MAG: hypothetical protein COC06_12480 [Bacteroidales bacterium]